jgi:hypothetical protein
MPGEKEALEVRARERQVEGVPEVKGGEPSVKGKSLARENTEAMEDSREGQVKEAAEDPEDSEGPEDPEDPEVRDYAEPVESPKAREAPEENPEHNPEDAKENPEDPEGNPGHNPGDAEENPEEDPEENPEEDTDGNPEQIPEDAEENPEEDPIWTKVDSLSLSLSQNCYTDYELERRKRIKMNKKHMLLLGLTLEATTLKKPQVPKAKKKV